MTSTQLSTVCSHTLLGLSTWRKVKSDGQIYRVHPRLIGDAKSGDKRWITYDRLPMLVEVL